MRLRDLQPAAEVPLVQQYQRQTTEDGAVISINSTSQPQPATCNDVVSTDCVDQLVTSSDGVGQHLMSDDGADQQAISNGNVDQLQPVLCNDVIPTDGVDQPLISSDGVGQHDVCDDGADQQAMSSDSVGQHAISSPDQIAQQLPSSKVKRAKRGHPRKSEWKREANKHQRMKGEAYMGFAKNVSGLYTQSVTKEPRRMGPHVAVGKEKNVNCLSAVSSVKRFEAKHFACFGQK